MRHLGMGPGVGQARGEQLEQHHSQAVDVAGCADLIAARLFGRHVGQSADDEPRLRVAGFIRGHETGQAKITDQRMIAMVHEDVARLDVAVQDAGLVDGVDGAGDGGCQPGGLARRHGRREGAGEGRAASM